MMNARLLLLLALMATAGCDAADSKSASEAPELGGPQIDASASDAGVAWDESGNAPGADQSAGARAEGEPTGGAPPVDVDVAEPVESNPFVDADEEAISTFSVDTDTASYTIARALLNDDLLPEPQTVRIEEYINFFRWNDPAPGPDEVQPFGIQLDGAPSPFGDGQMQLLRIGLKGLEVPAEARLPANLVFLIDTSGSMNGEKLDLVKFSLGQLVRGLQPTDTLSIVTYAGADTVLLRPTRVENRGPVLEAISALSSRGGTNGADGIRTAYALAQEAFIEGGINRVVLCTDGDFNVGLTAEPLVQLVESWRDQQVFLTVLGYGRNFNDSFLESLTNRADGNYAFIDGRNEALRVLGERLVGTLQIIAKDVKIQVEFDPELVERFRLIGYENRVLANADFRNDAVDAGEIGSGHSVVAYYELALRPVPDGTPDSAKLATVRVRYKAPEGGDSSEVSRGISAGEFSARFEAASADLRFGAAVAEFAEILRASPYSEGRRFEALLDIAEGAAGDAPDRLEFLQLARAAAALMR